MALEYIYQTDELKQRVWVHASDGSTVGRFSVRFGMDVHNTVTEQMAGRSECLDCRHSGSPAENWRLFRAYAQDLWGIDIPEDAIDLPASAGSNNHAALHGGLPQ